MSQAPSKIPWLYNVAHINPYYKALFGWVTPKLDLPAGKASVKDLWPAASPAGAPVIVSMGDSDQYYLVEFRDRSGFDFGLTEGAGINIWRVDKLGLEAIYSQRKGITCEGVIGAVGQSVTANWYTNSSEISDVDEVVGISITWLSENRDGSVTVKIDRLL